MKIGTEKWKRIIGDATRAMGIDIDGEKIDKFAIHARELMKWNKRINLTAIRDPLAVAEKHFVDSLIPAPMVPPETSLLDVGSGGGFPGIPLKILIPSLKLTLIDASRKKVSFLKYIIRTLNLVDAGARHIRVEELAENEAFANHFGVIISRALFDLHGLVIKTWPLLSEKGVIIGLKGKPAQEEIDTLRRLDVDDPHRSPVKIGRFSLTIKKFTLPYTHSKRTVVAIKALSKDPQNSSQK